MIPLHFKTRIGENRLLKLTVPAGFENRNVEVVVTPQAEETNMAVIERDALGWPVDFFTKIAGSIPDETFKRWPQGEYEEIEEL